MRTLTMRSAGIVMAATMVVISVLDCGPAGATSNRTQLVKAWTALQGDFNQVQAGLNTNNATKAETAFYDFSRDCIPLATFETSFSTTINADIFSVAQLGNAWAWMGYITLSTNSSVGPFKTETSRLTTALTKFTHDLGK